MWNFKVKFYISISQGICHSIKYLYSHTRFFVPPLLLHLHTNRSSSSSLASHFPLKHFTFVIPSPPQQDENQQQAQPTLCQQFGIKPGLHW